MSRTNFSTDILMPDVRSAAMERQRDRWMLGVPVLISAVALYHLITCWNSPEPTLMAMQPHRIIHVVRAGQQVKPSTSLVPDDVPAFDPAILSWPCGAGWR